jgi:penicillin-binding protein 2
VLKLVIAACALETGKISTNFATNCTGSTFVGRQEFACWNTHGVQNLLGAITRSCNIFFYKTGLLLGGQLIHDYAVKFGFSKLTGIDLPGEQNGFVPGPFWRKVKPFRSWREGDTANFSIGQGELLVTPIQVLRMVAVFANQGYLVSPYLVRSIDGRDISAYQRKIDPIRLKDNVIEQVRKGMRGVVAQPDGTASILGTLSVSVAGKTGTAQAPPGLPHGWFAGFFPYQQPKYAICVFLERGGAGYYSSLIAKQIIERMINEGLIK